MYVVILYMTKMKIAKNAMTLLSTKLKTGGTHQRTQEVNTMNRYNNYKELGGIMNDFDSARTEYNGKVIRLLEKITKEKPSLRISQIIRDTHPLEEPWDTYARLISMYGIVEE